MVGRTSKPRQRKKPTRVARGPTSGGAPTGSGIAPVADWIADPERAFSSRSGADAFTDANSNLTCSTTGFLYPTYATSHLMEDVKGSDGLGDTELRLGLPGTSTATRSAKRALPEGDEESHDELRRTSATKAQVVGWPPIRSYRKNSFPARKVEAEAAAGLYVKVSMDGAPFLRKIDLSVYKGYKELREGLDNMFKCFSFGELSRREGGSGSEYAITYEDKDGDLMLVGDVPWE
ncbi:hypothetical protein BHE74_00026180 [Ensete ventricosum]|nr:hypothetical protein BHE74_00026180 [Ensete ventricosum]RZS03541.1 hypothetical protein BHM03_00033733 [Ensete ventricosum]